MPKGNQGKGQSQRGKFQGRKKYALIGSRRRRIPMHQGVRKEKEWKGEVPERKSQEV